MSLDKLLLVVVFIKRISAFSNTNKERVTGAYLT